MSRKFVAVLALCAAPPLAHAGGYCYTLLDRGGRVVSQSAASPIDLSRRIADVLAEQYPGHHFVFGLAENCVEVAPPPPRAAAGRSEAARAASTAALLRRYPDIAAASDRSAADGAAASGYGDDGRRGGAGRR